MLEENFQSHESLPLGEVDSPSSSASSCVLIDFLVEVEDVVVDAAKVVDVPSTPELINDLIPTLTPRGGVIIETGAGVAPLPE